jgi:hypothetical protein
VSTGFLLGGHAVSNGASPPARASTGHSAVLLARTPPTTTTTTIPVPVITTVTATPAENLLNMEGVNIHSSYGTTPYGNLTQTVSLLQQLGIKHVRDPLSYNPGFVRSDQYDFYNQLEADGIGIDLVVSPGTDQSDLAARLNTVATYFPNAVDALEAPNEANMIPGDTNWAAQDISYTQNLYTLAKANPALKNITVLGPSMANFLALHDGELGFLSLGNLSASLDAGNVHLYPGGRDPTWEMSATQSAEAMVSGNKPLWVTEAGYHDAVDNPGNFSASDAAIATYLPRLFLEWYQRGAARVNLYQLYDEFPDPSDTVYSDHFGLVSDNGQPKPQFYAVENFNKLLEDTGTVTDPGSLTYSISSGATKVSSLLLEKSNGQFQLFLWQDVSVSNTATNPPTDTPVAATPVTVTFQNPVSSITEYRPSLSADPQATSSNTSTFTVNLQGDATALTIQP